MASQIAITNLALGRIGANLITSLSENTTEQVVAVNAWDISRRAVLREHPWNFALEDIELAQVADYVPFEYQRAYTLPSDCLRVVEVYGNPYFKIQGNRILCDVSVVKLKYVKDVLDTALWDASFTDVMSYRLAADMHFALTKSQSGSDSMYSIYAQKLKIARHIDSTEDVQDVIGGYESAYINVRGS